MWEVLRAGCAAAPALVRGLLGTREGGRVPAMTKLGLLLLSACSPDSAEPSPDVDLTAIEARLDALEDQHAADMATLQAQHDADVAALNARVDALEAELELQNADVAALAELVAALEEALAALEVLVGDLEGASGLPDVVARLAEVLSEDASGDLILEGVNLWIRSGGGATEATPNGKGNLLLGYGEADGSEARTGSHTLVIGPGNDWLGTYGIVVGQNHLLGVGGGGLLGGESGTVNGAGGVVVGGNASTVSHRNAVNVGGTGSTSSYECGIRASGLSSGSGC